MGKNYQKIINISIIGIIILTIGVAAMYKTNKTYKEKVFSSIKTKIIENALKCHNEEKCESQKVTLKELYDKNYIEEELINPFNKEYINPDSYVEITSPNEGKITIIDE